MADARSWAPPRWVPYDKHRPPQGIEWAKLVKQTGTLGGAALYHPSITLDEQRLLESAGAMPRHLFLEHRHKRMYFMDVGRIIGASSGNETTCLYAEVLSSGELHDRPITIDDLRRKGAEI